jgi:RNAse (barnase) inhibitor barstar
MREYEIDGRAIHELEDVFTEFAKAVAAPNGYFGADLQSFDDCLFGGCGLEAPCRIVWKHSADSSTALDSAAFVRWCDNRLSSESPEGREHDWLTERREAAEAGKASLFAEVVSLIQSASDRTQFGREWPIELVLE